MPRELPEAARSLLEDLVIGNRILYARGIVDGLGHISARHDKDPSIYILAAEKAPGRVTLSDLALHDLDSNALTLKDRRPYLERFIHGEIYKARPDVHSIVHCHAPALVAFCVCQAALRPVYHMSGFLGHGVGRFEIRETSGMTDMLVSSPELGNALAKSLSNHQIVLMRGHGATIAGQTIKHTVFRANYAVQNALIQMNAMGLGEITYLSEDEAIKSTISNDRVADRSWDLWKEEALKNSRLD